MINRKKKKTTNVKHILFGFFNFPFYQTRHRNSTGSDGSTSPRDRSARRRRCKFYERSGIQVYAIHPWRTQRGAARRSPDGRDLVSDGRQARGAQQGDTGHQLSASDIGELPPTTASAINPNASASANHLPRYADARYCLMYPLRRTEIYPSSFLRRVDRL